MNIRNIALAAALVAFVAVPNAAKAASDSASASATIAAAVTVTKQSDLQFGLISPTATAGTVTISNTGTRTGNANVVLQSGATPTKASFLVAGAASQAVTVTIPATANLTGPGTDMVATLNQTLAGSQTLDGSGNFTVDVGATLAVGASQAAGAYAGSFNVTVVYN